MICIGNINTKENFNKNIFFAQMKIAMERGERKPFLYRRCMTEWLFLASAVNQRWSLDGSLTYLSLALSTFC
jgi:hypothetical protein